MYCSVSYCIEESEIICSFFILNANFSCLLNGHRDRFFIAHAQLADRHVVYKLLWQHIDVDTGKAQVECYSEGQCPENDPELIIGEFNSAKECCILDEALSWQTAEPCAACLSTWLYTPQYVACAIVCPCFQKMISSELRFPFPLTISTLILWHSLIHALFRDLVSVYYTAFIMKNKWQNSMFWCVLLQ